MVNAVKCARILHMDSDQKEGNDESSKSARNAIDSPITFTPLEFHSVGASGLIGHAGGDAQIDDLRNFSPSHWSVVKLSFCLRILSKGNSEKFQ